MTGRERRDYIAITLVLQVLLFIQYLTGGDNAILALTILISAAIAVGTYWLARRKRKNGNAGDGAEPK